MSKVTKFICDHCKKEIITTQDNPFPWTIEIMPNSNSRCERHLCDKCMDDLFKWFAQKPKDNDGEFNAHETLIGKALDAGHIYR